MDYYTEDGYPAQVAVVGIFRRSRRALTVLFAPWAAWLAAKRGLPCCAVPAAQIDGGDPILLDGQIFLCSRADDPAERHYDGELAYLGLYDAALNETQVRRAPSCAGRAPHTLGSARG